MSQLKRKRSSDDESDYDVYENIFDACEYGDLNDVKKYLTAGGDPNAITDGKTLLYIAVEGYLKPLVRLLLAQEGIDVNKTSPLAAACRYGNEDDEIFMWLLNAGANPNQKDSLGYTPLYVTCSNNFIDKTYVLLADNRVDVNAQSSYFGYTALYIATHRNHVEIVNALLRREGQKSSAAGGLAASKVDPNIPDRYGETPLYIACKLGHTVIVRALCGFESIDPNKAVRKSSCNKGWTPLHVAVSRGHNEIVETLLTAPGIDVDRAEDDGRTPLFLACGLRVAYSAKDYANIVLRLLRAGADPNISDKYHETPLCRACSYGHRVRVKLLLRDPRIDVNQVDGQNHTPLYVACFENHDRTVKVLLKDPRVDVNQGLVLFIACYNGHDAIVKRLLKSDRIVDFTGQMNRYLRQIDWASGNQRVKDTIKRLLKEYKTELLRRFPRVELRRRNMGQPPIPIDPVRHIGGFVAMFKDLTLKF